MILVFNVLKTRYKLSTKKQNIVFFSKKRTESINQMS